MTSDYTRHAYAQTILGDLRRYLLDRYVATEIPAKTQLVCETVFYNEREVPQDAFIDMLDRLERIEAVERAQMQTFELRRRQVPGPAESPPPAHRESPVEKPVEKRKRKSTH